MGLKLWNAQAYAQDLAWSHGDTPAGALKLHTAKVQQALDRFYTPAAGLKVPWKYLGWYNTLAPLWVPNCLAVNAFAIFLLRQAMKGIPKDLEEAAKIDGCGWFRIYWSVALTGRKSQFAEPGGGRRMRGAYQTCGGRGVKWGGISISGRTGDRWKGVARRFLLTLVLTKDYVKRGYGAWGKTWVDRAAVGEKDAP